MQTTTPTPPESPTTCGFSYPGSMGHECGKPAVWAGSRTSHLTVSGVYHPRRCDECKLIVGGENTGVFNWEPFDPIKHQNKWK